MKKKNLIYLIIAIVLILVSVFVVLYENNAFSKLKSGPASNAFSIKDTSAVTKIFIADMHENSVLLAKTDRGWTVNDTLAALPQKVENLLSILSNLTIRQNVPKETVSTINTVLATGGTKVEIYQIAPKFKLFGIKFGEKERLVKTYYMGPATQDNMANFALLEGMDEPYIVHIPGFRGFVTPQFSAFEYEWISHLVFNTKITRIKSAEFLDPIKPEESFRVEKAGARFFNVYDYQNNQIINYDTVRMIDMLSEFRNKNFEYIDSEMSDSERDSLFSSTPFKIITIEDVDGNKSVLTAFRMRNRKDLYLDDYRDDSELPEWDLNRFYGIKNGNQDNLYAFQFAHMDRQMQPLSYFLHSSKR